MLWIAVLVAELFFSRRWNIRIRGSRTPDPGGAGRWLSSASSRSSRLPGASLLPACGAVLIVPHRGCSPRQGALHGRAVFLPVVCHLLSWLLSPGSSPDHPPRGGLGWEDGPCSPVREPDDRGKRGHSGESVPETPPLRSWSVNPGTSEWLSRVLPRDPHSDRKVRSSSTYNGKIYRVSDPHPMVKRLNRLNGKDIKNPRSRHPDRAGRICRRVIMDRPSSGTISPALRNRMRDPLSAGRSGASEAPPPASAKR